ncbi:hypothetical protein PMAYCL1PPCAC_12761 [Pristionchus mayeri]|uniref:Uncharacterized protein n=1 Tax=Pristionchus mayeri TaxID=1317129 RepID=A0AAN4ZP85_9BILA|nr:hypothetical protein PMAYCL1PPCAC_12761 [Pristionchus mayeri]
MWLFAHFHSPIPRRDHPHPSLRPFLDEFQLTLAPREVSSPPSHSLSSVSPLSSSSSSMGRAISPSTRRTIFVEGITMDTNEGVSVFEEGEE